MRLPRRFFLFFFFFFLLVISPPLRGPHAPPVLPTGVPPLIPRAASISMSLAALSRAYETITSSPLRDLLRRMMSNVSSTYSYLRARPTCTPLRVTGQGFHWSNHQSHSSCFSCTRAFAAREKFASSFFFFAQQR